MPEQLVSATRHATKQGANEGGQSSQSNRSESVQKNDAGGQRYSVEPGMVDYAMPSSLTDHKLAGLELPVDRLVNRARKHPARVYLRQPVAGRMIPYTWGRVLSESLRVASYLASLGLPTGSRIGILSKNCAHWIIVDYAIWLAGHVSVPLYPTLTGEAIHQVLQHAGAEVLFVGKVDDWSRQYDGVPPALTCIAMPLFKPSVSVESKMVDWQEILESNQPLADIPETHADQLATIIYTSGTTGVPKGVMHTFGGLAAAAGQASMIYQVSAQDRVLSYLPLSHVAERLVVELASLYEGYAVYFVESLETFARDLKQARPTIFFAVPRIWVKFQSGVSEQLPPKLFDALIRLPVLSLVLKQVILKKLGLHKVRLCLSGAAPLAASLLEWYKKLGLEILEVYGMTENMGYSHSTRAGDQHVGYVGLPNPGVMVKLSDVGEVLVRSVTNMVGYYRAPDETQKVITEDGFLCTGDLGELDRAGRLKITGRIKELFKTSKGKYVAPAPLENLLAAKREAEQVCVLGADLPQPLALITLSGEAKRRLDSDAVGLKRSFSLFLESVNEKVERHERLSHLVLLKDDWDVGSGLVTPSLKIKRHALEKHYADQVDRWSTAKEPIVLGDF